MDHYFSERRLYKIQIYLNYLIFFFDYLSSLLFNVNIFFFLMKITVACLVTRGCKLFSTAQMNRFRWLNSLKKKKLFEKKCHLIGKTVVIKLTVMPHYCSDYRTMTCTCAFRCSQRNTGYWLAVPLFPILNVPVPLWCLLNRSLKYLTKIRNNITTHRYKCFDLVTREVQGESLTN